MPALTHRPQLPDAATRRALREAAGLTLWDLGDALGVDGSTIWHWERGRQPRREAARAYAALLADIRRRLADGPREAGAAA